VHDSTTWSSFEHQESVACAFLMACATAAASAPPAAPWHPRPHPWPITLTAAEIRRLLSVAEVRWVQVPGAKTATTSGLLGHRPLMSRADGICHWAICAINPRSATVPGGHSGIVDCPVQSH